MSVFADIDTIWEYHQLLDKASKTKPYRTSSEEEPKYPLGNRRYSDRYFKPRIDLIDEVRDSPYGVKESIVITNKDGSTDTKPMPWTYYNPPIEIYYTDRYKLGTFHSDSTFEFNPSAGGYGQGDTGVMSSVLPGWISSKAQYGGLVFYHRQTRSQVPVFEGLRIRLCDGTPVQNYELHVNSLDRKATKGYRSKHDDMFKLGLTMLKAMGVENFVKELESMVEGQVAPAFNYKHEDLFKAFSPEDAAGAILWLALRYNVQDCRYKFAYKLSWSYNRFIKSMSPENLVRNVRNYFYKEIYNIGIDKGEKVLQTKVYKFGDKLPTVEWGSQIIVDGAVHKRLV